MAEARAKAEDILKEIKAGGDFAKLAEKYSDDPGPPKTGANWAGSAAAAPYRNSKRLRLRFPKGRVSDLVKTSYGFHIIHVEDKQDAHLKSLPEVKKEIADKVKQQKMAHATETAANAMLSAARTDGLRQSCGRQGRFRP